ncbi:MAG: hypothetical protein HQL76_15570 [Magnetococcales bacterium]|nr:hypothetical protein [Magnetococcales bacterium]
MFEKNLLFLTRDLLTVYPWKRGEVSGAPRRFPATIEGRAALVAALAERRGIPSYLLVDLVEEEFMTETQPHVLGPDRRSLVARRLQKAFPNTPFRHLRIQEREKGKGRRDDRTLLSGITDPDLVLPWVRALGERRLPLAGIHSLPMVGRRLLTALGATSKATLMVSWQSTSGLRFSFYSGNHLRMSRMAPVPAPDPENYARSFIAELERTRGYLQSLRLVPRECPIRVVLITSSEMLDHVRPLCPEGAGMTFDMRRVRDVARLLGIGRPITTPFSDSLFIQILGRRRPENHYADAGMTMDYHTGLVKKLLHAASAILSVTAILGGGMNLYQGFSDRVLGREKGLQVQAIETRYRAVIGSRLPVGIDPATMRRVVRMVDLVAKTGKGPFRAMTSLSRWLLPFSALRLDALTWKGPLHPAVTALHGSRSGPRGVGGPDAGKQGTRAGSEHATPGSSFSPGDHLELMEFKGEIEKIDGDVALGHDQIRRLIAAMKGDPEVVRVDSIELPGAREPVTVLSGDLSGPGKEEARAVFFTLGVVFRREEAVHED